jgi:nitrous oxide reductase accessory protein NosL
MSKRKQWSLPVEESYIDGVAEYFITIPDDLAYAAEWFPGDELEWVDNKDGSYTIIKVTK